MSYYIGIDVSKLQLDVDWLGSAKTYDNNLSGLKRLIKVLGILNDENKLSLIICEATGGYEQLLVRACHEAQLPIHVAHANKVRHFAKSQGLLAKTDKMDAKVLSDYGRLLQPDADSILLNDATEKMADLLKRREQLLADKKREHNRLDKILGRDIERSIKRHIKWLDENITEIDKLLAELKKTDEVKEAHNLLTSIPAIGDISAFYLQACLPELGKLSNKALAALIGVAPFNNDSGKGSGKRFIQGGRSRLRQILYMAAITATRCNLDLRTFYLRLVSQGKATKVAIVAVIRKLITMANSVMKRRSPWVDVYTRC